MQNRHKVLIFILVLSIGAGYIYSIMAYSGQSDNGIFVDSKSNHYQTLGSIISAPKYKDRLIYVDIWGTRCGPCLNEFPASKKLVEHYKGNSRISFLYLCSPYGKMDDEFRWKRYIQKYDLKGDHVLLTEKAYFKIYEEIESKPDHRYFIPRHLIVKNGKLIMSDAPTPVSPELVPIIDSLQSRSF